VQETDWSRNSLFCVTSGMGKEAEIMLRIHEII